MGFGSFVVYGSVDQLEMAMGLGHPGTRCVRRGGSRVRGVFSSAVYDEGAVTVAGWRPSGTKASGASGRRIGFVAMGIHCSG